LCADRVFGHEAVVVESLEQRHTGDSPLCEEITEMMLVERAKGLLFLPTQIRPNSSNQQPT
jgi:hypothetical protein